jgi:hypothetical protein
MAAIASAIDSAIHRRLTALPMSPPKIRAALDTGQADDYEHGKEPSPASLRSAPSPALRERGYLGRNFR